MIKKDDIAYEFSRFINITNSMKFQIAKNPKFHLEPELYCPITDRLLYVVCNECSKRGSNEARLSTHFLANVSNSTRYLIRKRLIVLAQYGLLKLVQEWRNDGSRKMKSQNIVLNEKLLYLLNDKPKATIRNQIIKDFVALGQARLESEEPVQGFKSDSAIGCDEDNESGKINSSSPDEIEESIVKDIEKEDKKKADKEAERIKWKKLNDKFVQGASELWRFGQMKAGNGDAMPHWAAPVNQLAPAARKERANLVKIFEFYGGRTACLAWFMFSCGRPEIDPNTLKPKFDMKKPYKQFVSIDKRPESFAKYFNSILKDKDFKDFSTLQWKTFYPRLKGYFGEALDQMPRDGGWDIERLGGIVYGEVAPKLDAIKHAADERRKHMAMVHANTEMG